MVAYVGESVTINPLDTPGAPTLTRHGVAGETSYGYKVVAKRGNGVTAASTEATIANGPSTLNGAHWIAITPGFVAGAEAFDIYRTTGGATQGKIGTLAPVNSGGVQHASFADRGRTASEGDAPTTNTTGQLVLGSASSGQVLTVNDSNAVVPVEPGNFIAAPIGGGTEDAEARTVIGSILTLLQAKGLMQGD
jgi:hypothetical protein